MTDIILVGEAQRAHAIALISKLDLSKRWKVTVARHQNKRSLNQNSLYWKWLGIIAQETGHEADELHEYFKAKFLPPVFVELEGEAEAIRRSTTKLNTQDMSDYMDKVNAFAASQLGIILPQPDDQ